MRYLILSICLAIYYGFFAFKGDGALIVFDYLAYYWVSAIVVGFGVCGLWQCRLILARWEGKRWETLWVAGALLVASVFCTLAEEWGMHVVMDEPMLVATSYTMSTYGRTFLPYRGHEVGDMYVSMELMAPKDQANFVDKRPVLFPFLVSVAHDVRGFHFNNGSLVNAILCPFFFLFLYLFLRGVAGPWGGLAGVFLMCGLPLLPWVVSGSGLEVVTLVVFMLLLLSAQRYLKELNKASLSVLCLAGVLIAQTRYEMVLFVPVCGLVILLGWWKAKRVILSWMLIVMPLCFVPYVWQQRVFQKEPGTFQVEDALKKGLFEAVDGPFSLSYVWPNLKANIGFYFNPFSNDPSNVILSCFGLVGLVAAGIYAFKQRRHFLHWPAKFQASFLMGLGSLATFFLFLLYVWGAMTDAATCRFSLLFSVVGLMAFVGVLHAWRVRKEVFQALCVMGLVMAYLFIGKPLNYHYHRTRGFIHEAVSFMLHRLDDLQQDPKNKHALYMSEMTQFSCCLGLNSVNNGIVLHDAHYLTNLMDEPIYVFQVARYNRDTQTWEEYADLEGKGYVLRLIDGIAVTVGADTHRIRFSKLLRRF